MIMSRKGLLTGFLVGVGLGVLFAPKKGSETRAELKAKCNELYEKLKEVELSDVKTQIENKLANLQKELKTLDKEKVGAICRQQATKIKAKAEELYELAKEKGVPTLQKTAEDIRSKSADLLHTAADKIDCPKEEPKPKKPRAKKTTK